MTQAGNFAVIAYYMQIELHVKIFVLHFVCIMLRGGALILLAAEKKKRFVPRDQNGWFSYGVTDGNK